MRKKNNLQINIPQIPSRLPKFESIVNLTKEEIDIKINEGGVLNDKNMEIKFMNPTNMKNFIDTILYALKDRYGIVLTVEDIYRELNMTEKRKMIVKKK